MMKGKRNERNKRRKKRKKGRRGEKRGKINKGKNYDKILSGINLGENIILKKVKNTIYFGKYIPLVWSR